MLAPAPALTAERARQWSRRVPPALVRWTVMAVVVAVLVISAVTDDSSDDNPASLVESPSWYLAGVCFCMLVGTLVVAIVAPSVALVLAALAATMLVVLPEAAAGDNMFLAVPATVLVALVIVDTVHRRRQRSLRRAWRQEATTAVVVPEVPQPQRVQLNHRRWGLLIVAWIGAVIGVLGFIVLAHDVVATAAFRDDSLVALTTVDSVTQNELAVRVTIDGQSYRVPVSTVPPAGSPIEVRYQPRSGRAEATADVFDPTPALLPVVGGSVVAVAFFILARVRRRESAAFFADGGLAYQVRAVGSPPSRRVLLYAMDEPRRPVAVAKKLQTWFGPLPSIVQPGPGDLGGAGHWIGAQGAPGGPRVGVMAGQLGVPVAEPVPVAGAPVPPYVEAKGGQPWGDPYGGAPQWGAPPAGGEPWGAPPAGGEPWGAPPAGGEPWGGQPWAGQPWAGQPWGGQPWAPQPSDPLRGPVTVVGFGRVGGPAALLDNDGRWWVISGGLRRPRRSDRPAPPSRAGDGWVG